MLDKDKDVDLVCFSKQSQYLMQLIRNELNKLGLTFVAQADKIHIEVDSKAAKFRTFRLNHGSPVDADWLIYADHYYLEQKILEIHEKLRCLKNLSGGVLTYHHSIDEEP